MGTQKEDRVRVPLENHPKLRGQAMEERGEERGEVEEIHRGKEGGGVNTTTSGLQTTGQNWTRLMSPGEERIFVLSG